MSTDLPLTQLYPEVPLPEFGKAWLHPCALHLGELVIDEPGVDDYPSCSECGCMLNWDSCPWCGTCWIVFGGETWDDTIRDAGITESGDLMCANCAEEEERAEMEDQQDMYYSHEDEEDYA